MVDAIKRTDIPLSTEEQAEESKREAQVEGNSLLSTISDPRFSYLSSTEKSTLVEAIGLLCGAIFKDDGAGGNEGFPAASHVIGSHIAGTLASLNSMVSDATLIDTADSRLTDSRSCDNTFDSVTVARTNLGVYGTAEVDAMVVGLYDHKGAYNASTNTPAIEGLAISVSKGDAYTVSAAGAFYEEALEVGDILISDVDSPTLLSQWTRVNKNLSFGTSAGTACEGDDSRLSDVRTPISHSLAGSEHAADTLANLNSKVSDATLIDTGDSRLSNSRDPNAHSVGSHTSSTLADLNAVVSDATLIDDRDSRLSDSRTPSGGAGGDLYGTYPNPTVIKLQGRAMTGTAPTTGQTIAWDGSKWGPTDPSGGAPTGTAGGDLGGTYPNPTVDALQGVEVSPVGPKSGEYLKFDGTSWVPKVVTVAGTASGDLSGMYPSPVVSQLQGRSMLATAPTTGQVIEWSGSAWAPATPATSSGTDIIALTNTLITDINTSTSGATYSGWDTTASVESGSVWAAATDGVTIDTAGIYRAKVIIYQESTGTRTNVGVRITVDGTAVGPLGAGAYLRNSTGHDASSSATEWVMDLDGTEKIGVKCYRMTTATDAVAAPAGLSALVIERVS